MSGSGNVSAARIRTASAMGGASSGRGAVKSAPVKNSSAMSFASARRNRNVAPSRRREELQEELAKLREQRIEASKVLAELTQKFWAKKGTITPAESRRNARAERKVNQLRDRIEGIRRQLDQLKNEK